MYYTVRSDGAVYGIASYAAPIQPTGKCFKIMGFDSALGPDNAVLGFLINAPVLAFSTESNFKQLHHLSIAPFRLGFKQK